MEFEPFVALAADGVTNLEFQQDNARPHVARRIRKFLDVLDEKHRFTIMDFWPPNSLDLLPIENLWAHLELELHRQYPDTAALTGSPQRIKALLCQRLNEVWWNIGAEVLMSLVESMPQRVEAVLQAKGWYTEF